MRVIRIGTKQGDFGEYEIENKLIELQEAVGGYIEVTTLPELNKHNIVMIVNEEGLLSDLPTNKNLYPFLYIGNVLLATLTDDNEDFASLTGKQFAFAMNWLRGLTL